MARVVVDGGLEQRMGAIANTRSVELQIGLLVGTVLFQCLMDDTVP